MEPLDTSNTFDDCLCIDGCDITTSKLVRPGTYDSTEIDELANLTDLDEYLELLYEDIPEKLRASLLILQLARNPDNLEELFQNETLIGALARVLREDWKKCTDLATNITCALIMTIIHHEIQKYELWLHELEQKCRSIQTLNTNKQNSFENYQNDYENSRIKFKSLVKKQEQLFQVSFYLLLNISEDLNVEHKMHKKGILIMICKCLNRDNFELLMLLVSFLKKLSMFGENKDEMIKLKIIDKLQKFLLRPEEDLVNITLKLLVNLSFDTQARIEMVSQGILDTIVSLLDKEIYLPTTLHILYHLSVEDKSKPAFAKTTCIDFLIRNILENCNPKSNLILMALAINLVCDDTCARSMFGEGQNFKLFMKRALKIRDPLILKLLRNATLNNEKLKLKLVDYLPELVKIIIINQSSLSKFSTSLIQIQSTISNCKSEISEDSDHDLDTKFYFKDEDFVFECLGSLANLNLKTIDFSKVLNELKLLDWIQLQLESVGQNFNPVSNHLSDKLNTALSDDKSIPHCEDDVLLEIIRLLHGICQDINAAQMVIEYGLIQQLIGLLNAKQEDDEIVYQIIYLFYKLICFQETRDSIIQTTQVPAYFADLMHDKNAHIRNICDTALDIISESDPIWETRIQAERFRWHNSQWLEMIVSERNSTLIDNDLTTNSALAAALNIGHVRSLNNDGDGDIKKNSGLVDYNNDDDDQIDRGPFGMGIGIDDAAAFLMNLSSSDGFYNNDHSLEVDYEDNNYLNHLKILYPDMYEDNTILEHDSAEISVASQYNSESETTPRNIN